MQRFLLLWVLLLGTYLAKAQSDTLMIQQTILTFFDGMRQNDSTMIKQTLSENCSLRSVGKTRLMEEKMTEFLQQVGTKKAGVLYDERLQSFDISIDANMAIAWTPYRFYLNEKFNHCGVNVFTLMKTTDGWKIIAIIDTRRKENCE